MIRCDYCGDALPSVQSRAHVPTTPDLQRLGFSADKVVCPECVSRARLGPAASCHLCVGAGGYEDHDGEWVECSCQRPASEGQETALICPDCRDGKHSACIGTAWNDTTDAPTDCQCDREHP